MSLRVEALQDSLRNLLDPSAPGFVPYQPDRGVAAYRLCSAYDVYARDAVDQSGDQLVTANLPGMQQSFASGLSGSSTANAAAEAFAVAYSVYWIGASFAVGRLPRPGPPTVGGNGIFSTEIASTVLSVMTDRIYNMMALEFGRLTTGEEKVNGLAAAMHASTIVSVSTTISGLDTSPPPAGPLPCSNTGLIS